MPTFSPTIPVEFGMNAVSAEEVFVARSSKAFHVHYSVDVSKCIFLCSRTANVMLTNAI